MPTQPSPIYATDLIATEARSLKSNFSWTLAGNVVYSGCQWGMISALAKLGNTALVGRFALGLAIAAPVFMFTNLQLRAVQATDARSEFEFADYFTLRLLASMVALAAVCCIVLAGRFDAATAAVIVLIGAAKAIESLSDVVAGLLQKFERLDRAAISLMIRGTCSVLAFATAFWAFRNLIAPVAALVAVWLSVFLLYDLRQTRALVRGQRRYFAFRWSRLWSLVKVSISLGIVATLISLNVNIPRYILEHKLGPADLGIFASLAYLLVAINLVVNALGQSAIARLSRMFAEGDSKRFIGTLGKLLAFGGLILVLGAPVARWVGRPLLTVIYRPEYGTHVSLFVIMVVTAGVSSISSFLGCGMTAARAFRMQVPVIAASTLTTVIASYILISRWGSAGAAYALLMGACVSATGGAVVLRAAVRRLEGNVAPCASCM